MTKHVIGDVPEDIRVMFEDLTIQLIGAGFKHYSADAILHRIRWTMHVERNDRDFKCNNNWTSCLARWFMDGHPAHAGFFEIRAAAGDGPMYARNHGFEM